MSCLSRIAETRDSEVPEIVGFGALYADVSINKDAKGFAYFSKVLRVCDQHRRGIS